MKYLSATRGAVVRSWDAVRSAVDAADIWIAIALGLISYGCWDLYRPAAFIVPGVALLWIALPPRPPFFDRTEPAKKPQRRG